MPHADGSPIRTRAGHDLHERSPSRSRACLGRTKASGFQLELSGWASRIARELWIFLAGGERAGPVIADTGSSVMCGVEGNSWPLLRSNSKRQTSEEPRPLRTVRSRRRLTMTLGVGSSRALSVLVDGCSKLAN